MSKLNFKQVSVYLTDKELDFLTADKPISKRSRSATIRYAINKLRAEYAFNAREYEEPQEVKNIYCDDCENKYGCEDLGCEKNEK